MTSPTQVDSAGEISFRIPLNLDEASDLPDETCENRSMSTTNSAINDSSQDSNLATRSMVTNMADILKDVIRELQVLKNTPPMQRVSNTSNNNTANNQQVISDRNTRASYMHLSQGTDASSADHNRFTTGPRHPYNNNRMCAGQDQMANLSPRQNINCNQFTHEGQQNGPDQVYGAYQDVQLQLPSHNYRHPQYRTPQRYSSKCSNVKIPNFTGTEDWNVWLSRFETIADRNGWNEDDRLDQLLPRMGDQAGQFVFTQLPKPVLNDYQELTREMNSRYRVVETARAFAAKFSRRTQKLGETTADDFAADLKRLYDRAHGYRDRRTREEDLVRRFLDGLLDEEIRFEVEYHKEPENIDEAVFHVVNFIQTRGSRGHRTRVDPHKKSMRRASEAIHGSLTDVSPDSEDELTTEDAGVNCRATANTKSLTVSSTHEALIGQLIDRITKLEQDSTKQKGVKTFQPRNQNKPGIICYNCQQPGHKANKCPNAPRNINGKKYLPSQDLADQMTTTAPGQTTAQHLN